MGLIERFFKSGQPKGSQPGERASTQFHESEPDGDDSQAGRNASRRELVQVVLRDTMRKHGIPSDWIECRILSGTTGKRPGIHVNFIVRQAHERLLPYVFPFQHSFQSELNRFDPRCSDWLLSLGWEFSGFNAAQMPDPKSWSPSVPPAGAASTDTPAAVPGAGKQPESPAEESPKGDDDMQRDLAALFAIRDAALADAARKPAAEAAENDFQPTQPFEDEGEKPRA